MNILITGATGAIGTPLAKHLASRHAVTILTDKPHSPKVRALTRRGIHLIPGRLPNQLPDRGQLSRFETVIHLAAKIDFSSQARVHHQVNVQGTKNLTTRLSPHTHLIFTSTALIHGPSDTPLSETSPLRPLDPYTHTKIQAEAVVRKARATQGLNYSILRPTFITTPTTSGLQAKLAQLGNLPLFPLPGAGANLLPFLSYKDLIAAIDTLLSHGAINDVILLSPQSSQPLHTVVRRSCAKSPRILPLPRWTARPLHSYLRALLTQNWNFTSAKASQLLGWQPRHDPWTHKRVKTSSRAKQPQ